jgi:hypothetical protein
MWNVVCKDGCQMRMKMLANRLRTIFTAPLYPTMAEACCPNFAEGELLGGCFSTKNSVFPENLKGTFAAHGKTVTNRM